ncbi:MAG: hypothetical protein BJ554DRAFT_5575, partial [Olpidium bornovanus]
RKPRYLGVTPPISEAAATPDEIAVTGSLTEALKENGMFESEEESQRRCVFRNLLDYSPWSNVRGPVSGLRSEIVLGKLDKMVKDFVYKISAKKLPEPIARESGGKIFTFGSYRLGVHGSGTNAPRKGQAFSPCSTPSRTCSESTRSFQLRCQVRTSIRCASCRGT